MSHPRLQFRTVRIMLTPVAWTLAVFARILQDKSGAAHDECCRAPSAQSGKLPHPLLRKLGLRPRRPFPRTAQLDGLDS
jgi:hypothetical protein